MENQPITTTDLYTALEKQSERFVSTVNTTLAAMEYRLMEDAHKTQSEAFRVFESVYERQDIRLRRLEVEQQNMDASMSGRIAIVERRLFEIEKRLMLTPPDRN